MIDDRELLEAVCQKYIRPTEREAKPVVGVELEYPIVNLNGIGLSEVTQPVDFAVVQRLAEEFTVRFGFTDISRDEDEKIYLAGDPKTGDTISFDCSFNTMEFSFGIEEGLVVDRAAAVVFAGVLGIVGGCILCRPPGAVLFPFFRIGFV